MKRAVVWVLAAAGAVAAASCSDPLNRQPVSGTVKYRGKELAVGAIEFFPDDGPTTGSGARITDGRYAIPRAGGLSPGRYKVRVNAPDRVTAPTGKPPGAEGPPPNELLPAKYNSRTELTATVEAGQPNVFDFDLP